MREEDAILVGTILTIGIGLAAGILYFCKSNVCIRTHDLDVVSSMDVTYNDIYRNMEQDPV